MGVEKGIYENCYGAVSDPENRLFVLLLAQKVAKGGGRMFCVAYQREKLQKSCKKHQKRVKLAKIT